MSMKRMSLGYLNTIHSCLNLQNPMSLVSAGLKIGVKASVLSAQLFITYYISKMSSEITVDECGNTNCDSSVELRAICR